jgi:hypothetical protein
MRRWQHIGVDALYQYQRGIGGVYLDIFSFDYGNWNEFNRGCGRT